MAKKKVYAVRVGRQTGLFDSWEECRAAIDGYSDAEFKGFATVEEAEAYLRNAGTAISAQAMMQEEATQAVAQEGVTAYVDGSYDDGLKKYSFGCILFLPSGEVIREFGNGDNPDTLPLRNVAGEMLGAMYAVKWCEVNGYSDLILCYDYAGIEMWPTGKWKCNKEHTKKYAAFMQACMKQVHVTFRKIAAHTGDLYNEEADRLAKRALTEADGIPAITHVSSNCLTHSLV